MITHQRVSDPFSSSTGLFSFQFSSMKGLNAMLENGPWFILNNPLLLKKWHPDVNLFKYHVGTVPVWVKLHGVPVTAFSEDGKLDELVFEGIKEQVDPQSFLTFARIAYQCLHHKRERRSKAGEVVIQLKRALEFKWLSCNNNGERNEMVYATTFSYIDSSPHQWKYLPDARWRKVMCSLGRSCPYVQERLSEKDIGGLKQMFKMIDADNNGTIKVIRYGFYFVVKKIERGDIALLTRIQGRLSMLKRKCNFMVNDGRANNDRKMKKVNRGPHKLVDLSTVRRSSRVRDKPPQASGRPSISQQHHLGLIALSLSPAALNT
nr:protein kinase-like domain, phloem protein 2-like protein [Tanacetum cinerariifolium]